MPKIFCIETFLGCNLSCPECACGTKRITRKYGYLKFEQFKIIVEKIKPYAKYVFLHIWGEPLLNPEIIDIINYGQKFFQTQISTNCQNITEDLADKLVSSGTDICVSLDGMTQDIYEIYRNKGNINKVFDGINMIKMAQERRGINRGIQVQFIVFKHNEHQINDFQAFCKDNNLSQSLKAPAIYCNSDILNSDIVGFKRYKPSLKIMASCRDLNDVFNIFIDGSVPICCYDYNCVVELGNIFESSVVEIYNSVKINKIRSAMPIDFCINNCLM